MDTNDQEKSLARVRQYPDGKYRWTYELNLWKNPAIFLDLIKVFGFIIVGMWLFLVGLRPLYDRHFRLEEVLIASKVFMWVGVAFLVLCVVGYLIYAKMEGRYCVLFVMDEEGILHRQVPADVNRAQILAALAMLMDPAGGAPALLAASVSDWKTPYAKVRKVKARRRLHLIKVDELLTKNRVYVEDPEDYAFVLDFIRKRCPKLK